MSRQKQDFVITVDDSGRYVLHVDPRGGSSALLPDEMGQEADRRAPGIMSLELGGNQLQAALRLASGAEAHAVAEELGIPRGRVLELDELLTRSGLLAARDPAPSLEGAAPLVLDHFRALFLPVKDVQQSLSFYRDTLGFRAQRRAGRIEVALGETALVLAPRPQPAATRIEVSAGPGGIPAAVARLEAQGTRFLRSTDAGEDRLEIPDPDGHAIVLVAPPFAEDSGADLLWSNRRGRWAPVPRNARARGGRKAPPGAGFDALYASPTGAARWYRESFDAILGQVLGHFARVPSRLLELGCGYGFVASRLASLGFDVTAIDLAPAAIERNRQMFGSLHPRLRFEVADVLQPLAGFGTYDVVLDQGCFHNFGFKPAARARYLENLRQALLPGGLFILTTQSHLETTTAAMAGLRWNANELVQIFRSSFTPRYQTLYTQYGSSRQCNKEKRLLLVFERVAGR